MGGIVEAQDVEPRRCVVCGERFVPSSARSTRAYCYSKSCEGKAKRAAQRERREREVARQVGEHSMAQAVTADQLARAMAEIIRLRERLERADQERRRWRDLYALVVGQAHEMVRLEILDVNPASPAWDRREDFWQGWAAIVDWRPERGLGVDDELVEHRREMARFDREIRDAIRRGDDAGAGRRLQERVVRQAEYDREHPEQWAQHNIDLIMAAYRRDHDGEEMDADSAELEWYRREAKRRRKALDMQVLPISQEVSEDIWERASNRGTPPAENGNPSAHGQQ